MGKYDILVKDAELKLKLAKRRHEILTDDLDKACLRLDNAEQNYYKKSTAICNHEKVIRSLAAKLVWAKRKNK